MTFKASRWAKCVALIAATSVVASCGLPRSGPNKREIFSGSVLQEGDAFVVAVNDRVTAATAVVPALGFSQSFRNAGVVASDTINPGDTLSLTIWENVDDGLLASEGANATVLEEIQVDGSGFIFVPYAGRIKASGNTPEAIRRIITNKLEDQTPDPQVEVARVAGNGATVTILADTSSGVFQIERPTRRLAAMIAGSGSVPDRPEVTRVTVVRGGMSESVWWTDLLENPHFDIALRNNDRIIVKTDNRAFTALGATGAQARVPFETQTLSALEAIAQVGGLTSATADPTGVFVMRNENAEIAGQVLARGDLIGAQRMIYVLDLTEPNGMFMARDFLIRDGDTVYVTEAPFVQFDKAVSALTGSLGSVSTITAASGG